MSNYRRLISYIYAYEGGVKGKNIGYAKIEVRGDQCRIQVNVKKVYVGSNDIGVYLLSPGAEIMLGKIFIRGGAGEFRAGVHAGNVEGSGCSMDQCYGLTVHDVESTWQCYTTIWDDAVTQVAELGENHAGDAGGAKYSGDARDAGVVKDAGGTMCIGTDGGASGAGSAGDAGGAGSAGDAGGAGSAGDARGAEGSGDASGAESSGDASGAGSAGDAGHNRDAKDTGGAVSTMDTGSVRRAGEQPMGRGMGDVTEKAAEIELADVTSENVRAKEVPAKIPTEPGNGADLSTRFPVSAEIERELSEEEARLANVAPWEQEEMVIKEDLPDVWLPEPAEETLIGSMEKSAERMVEVSSKIKDYIGELADSVVEESMEGLQETIMEDSSLDTGQGEMAAEQGVNSKTADSMDRQKPDSPVTSARMMQEAVQQAIQALMGGIMTGPEKPAAREAAEPETGAKRKPAFRTEAEPAVKADIIPMPKAEEKTEQIKSVSPPPEPGDPARLEVLDRMEKEASSQNHIWNQLGRRYPRVLAFDYDYGCEILSIKPQDIGLLPREVWVYGNNSFLLHGYYNYRHLILAKLNNPKGRPRYLLGVPGHYFSNEKYMASMFGFPNFVLAKKQPEADGRYGYWYTDIRM